jgi:hypothetical protein
VTASNGEILDCADFLRGHDSPSLTFGELEEMVSDGDEGMVDGARSFLIRRDESELRGAVCCVNDDSEEIEDLMILRSRHCFVDLSS